MFRTRSYLHAFMAAGVLAWWPEAAFAGTHGANDSEPSQESSDTPSERSVSESEALGEKMDEALKDLIGESEVNKLNEEQEQALRKLALQLKQREEAKKKKKSSEEPAEEISLSDEELKAAEKYVTREYEKDPENYSLRQMKEQLDEIADERAKQKPEEKKQSDPLAALSGLNLKATAEKLSQLSSTVQQGWNSLSTVEKVVASTAAKTAANTVLPGSGTAAEVAAGLLGVFDTKKAKPETAPTENKVAAENKTPGASSPSAATVTHSSGSSDTSSGSTSSGSTSSETKVSDSASPSTKASSSPALTSSSPSPTTPSTPAVEETKPASQLASNSSPTPTKSEPVKSQPAESSSKPAGESLSASSWKPMSMQEAMKQSGNQVQHGPTRVGSSLGFTPTTGHEGVYGPAVGGAAVGSVSSTSSGSDKNNDSSKGGVSAGSFASNDFFSSSNSQQSGLKKPETPKEARAKSGASAFGSNSSNFENPDASYDYRREENSSTGSDLAYALRDTSYKGIGSSSAQRETASIPGRSESFADWNSRSDVTSSDPTVSSGPVSTSRLDYKDSNAAGSNLKQSGEIFGSGSEISTSEQTVLDVLKARAGRGLADPTDLGTVSALKTPKSISGDGDSEAVSSQEAEVDENSVPLWIGYNVTTDLLQVLRNESKNPKDLQKKKATKTVAFIPKSAKAQGSDLSQFVSDSSKTR